MRLGFNGCQLSAPVSIFSCRSTVAYGVVECCHHWISGRRLCKHAARKTPSPRPKQRDGSHGPQYQRVSGSIPALSSRRAPYDTRGRLYHARLTGRPNAQMPQPRISYGAIELLERVPVWPCRQGHGRADTERVAALCVSFATRWRKRLFDRERFRCCVHPGPCAI